jgi:hypothetical protein
VVITSTVKAPSGGLVLTTNLGFEHWTEVLGNERLTGAALDRLTHRATIVETTARATGSRTPDAGRNPDLTIEPKDRHLYCHRPSASPFDCLPPHELIAVST